MSQNIYDLFRYATDKRKFYRDGDRRPIAKSTVEREFMDMDPVLRADPVKLTQLVTSIMGLGQPFAVLFPSRQRPNIAQALHDIYISINTKLPIKVRHKKTIPQFYFVKPNGEYEFWSNAGPDSFTELALKESVIDDVIRPAYFAATPMAAYIRTKRTYFEFLGDIYDFVRQDKSLLLQVDPVLISWNPSVPAFKQLDSTLIVGAPTPAWDQFLARIDLPEVFMAFVWSCFEPTNTGRQCLWIYGNGHDGKSTALNAILDFYGRDYSFTIKSGEYKDNFFFGKVHGKRLGVYMDCANTSLLRSEAIKSILGGDTVSINDKFEKVFSSEVYSRLFVLGTKFPQINYSDNSERSRLLIVRVQTYTDRLGDPNQRANLRAEMPAFLAKCKSIYPTYFPNGENMPVPASMDELIQTICNSTDSELLEDFIESELEFGPEYELTKIELLARHELIFGSTKKVGEASFAFSNLMHTLLRRNVLLKRKTLKGGGKIGVITGVKLKSYVHKEKGM